MCARARACACALHMCANVHMCVGVEEGATCGGSRSQFSGSSGNLHCVTGVCVPAWRVDGKRQTVVA